MMLFYLSGLMFFFVSLFMLFFSMIMLIMKLSYFFEWNVIMIHSVNLNMLIYLDWMSIMFIFTVFMISSMILFYCAEYMSHDNYKERFFYLVFLFILSILLMIISPSMVSILIGWDGLGLVSYCLVIYYQNFSSFNSGMLTILLNRIGDVMLIMSIRILFIYGSWNFLNLNYVNLLVMILVMIASFTKSAQFPFSSWLPMAMAAPTPVSSLVHSSTLVTAGIYLLIRFNFLIYSSEAILMFIVFIGLITMLFSGMSANFEFDLKKIIAYSTLSQLGLMMVIYGMKNYKLAYFHLIIHAMFKSMMFMCSGVIIHYMVLYQDIRFMGNLKNFLPLTCSMFMISNYSLCGMPFMSGFFSKDQILEFMFMNNLNFIIYLLLLLRTGLTVVYSIRLMYYLMNKNFNFLPYMFISDVKLMNYPMVILMIFSIIFGSIFNWILFMNIEMIYLFKLEKLTVLLVCVTFILFGFMFFKFKNFMKFYHLKYFFGKMWFLYSMNLMIVFPLNLGKFYFLMFDKGWSEYYMKNSLNLNLYKVKNLEINLMMNYLIYLMMCMGLVMLLILIY